MLELMEDYRLGGEKRYIAVEKGHRPMRIDHGIQKCAVFLRCQSQSGLTWEGTGFLVGVVLPCKEPGRSLSYLVTARHVIEKIRSKATDGMVRVRVNLKGGDSDDFQIPVDKWRHHPLSHIDLSAICFTHLWREEMDHAYILQRHFLDNPDKIEGYGIGPGDDVFMTGLFKEFIGKKRNLPVIRAGNIAAMPSEPMELDFKDGRVGESPVYVVESRSIGGLSGSPVFWHDVPTHMQYMNPQSTATFFLGVMLGHWDEYAPTPDAMKKKDERINMGMAFVLPAIYLSELLNIPEFERERHTLAREEDEKSSVTLDGLSEDEEDTNQSAKRTVDRSIERLERGLEEKP